LQFSNELAKSLKGDPISEQQVQAPFEWDTHIEDFNKKVGKFEDLIVFGQHTNQQAQRMQAKLRKIQGRKSFKSGYH